MMASIMRYITGGKDTKQSTRDAIITLRQSMIMLEKKETMLEKSIEQLLDKAKKNSVSNKTVATAALRRKKLDEAELLRVINMKGELEKQISALESANLNQETLQAMKKASQALKLVHGNMTPEAIDRTREGIADELERANEIAEAISNVSNAAFDNEDELKAELEALEQDELNERLAGADKVPRTLPLDVKERDYNPKLSVASQEDTEEEQLRQLQEALAM